MIYEVETFLKSLRREGLAPSLGKVVAYFQQIFQFLRFMASPRPRLTSPEAAVEYAWSQWGGLFRPGQVRSEILALARLISDRRPEVVVEIGTANGGTFFLWSQTASPTASLISIDLPGGVHGGGYAYWRSFLYRRFAQTGQRIHLVRGSSYDPSTVKLIEQRLEGRQIDFLFIDGDHTLEGVKKDFELYTPFVRPGGIIALHDICQHPPALDCHVDDYWAQLKERYSTEEIIEDKAQGWGGIGVVFHKK